MNLLFEYKYVNKINYYLYRDTTCHNRTFNGSGFAIVRHSLSNDK